MSRMLLTLNELKMFVFFYREKMRSCWNWMHLNIEGRELNYYLQATF